MSEHRDEPDAGLGGGAWAAVRAGRWSVPVAAVVALAVVVAVVVVALLVRALTTVPEADLEAVGAAVSATPTDAAGGAGDGAGGAAGSRTRGASASAAAAGAPASGGSAPEGVPPAGGTPSAVVVHVVGQVRAPGLVELPAGARVADAVDAAGGLTTEADQSAVNLARPVLDGEQLVVPRPGEVPVPAPGPPPAGAPAPGAGSGGGAAGGVGAPPSPVSLSTATPAELDALPGIGPVLAQRIVDWREANGGFRSVDELAEVSGIGDAVLAQVRPLVVV